MTTYTVQGPSGSTYTIDGPAGATADQLGQTILANNPKERAAAETQREKAQYDPTNDMGTGSRLLAAVGRGMSSAARGLGQIAPMALSGLGMDGLASQAATVAPTQADVATAKQTDAPLLNTTAGKVGNALGMAAVAAPTMLIPGANTYTGATLIGALTGGLGTEGDLAERARGAIGGALGGAAGQATGNLIGAGAGAVRTALSNSAAAQAPRQAAVRAAQDAGYVLPPMQTAPTLLNAITQGIAGPVKTTQLAAARNQQMTNSLAARALGLDEGTAITPEVLQGVRSDAGSVYNEVRGIGQVQGDSTYFHTIDGLKGAWEGAAKDFPELADPKVTDILNAIRKPSFSANSAVDAIRILRNKADVAYGQNDKGLGNALRGGASALEDAIDRTLQRQQVPVYAPVEPVADAPSAFPQLTETAPGTALSTAVNRPPPTPLEQVGGGGSGDLLQRWRDARTLIAKSYDVEKALNGDNVSALTLAQIQKQRGNLTGELADIAGAASRFPKALANVREEPSPWSAIDGGIGLSAAYLHNPALLAIAAGGPVVRAAALSPAGQALSRLQPGPTVANATALALQSPQARRAMLLGGMTAGSNLIGSYAQ